MTTTSKPAIPGLDLEPAFAHVFNVTLNLHTTRSAFGEFVVGSCQRVCHSGERIFANSKSG